MDETELKRGVAALLQAYEDCWNRIRPTELRGLWDPAETAPYYVAEEITAPMRTWEAIEAYWREAETILLQWSMRIWDLHCKPVAPDLTGGRLAAIQFMMHWNGVVAGGDPRPIGLDVRVSAMARQTDGGWRFTSHYVESPPGPLPYLKSIYRQNVDPEFLAKTQGGG